MKLYCYSGYVYGEYVVGVIAAENKRDAERSLRNTYDDYKSWTSKRLEKVIFDSNNVCEVYYG